MVKLNWNPPKAPEGKAEYSWNVPYASIVHNGATRADGSRIPDRRWTDYAIQELINLPDAFKSHFESSGNLQSAFESLANDLDAAFREAIEAPVYDWDGETYRRNGSIAGSPRDIVDLGGLRDSQQLRFIP